MQTANEGDRVYRPIVFCGEKPTTWVLEQTVASVIPGYGYILDGIASDTPTAVTSDAVFLSREEAIRYSANRLREAVAEIEKRYGAKISELESCLSA